MLLHPRTERKFFWEDPRLDLTGDFRQAMNTARIPRL
jgi:hypothetical protein